VKKPQGPVTPKEAAHILEVFKTCDNVRETARKTGRSPNTVSRHVKQAGLEPGGRVFTQNTLTAVVVDAKARRARLSQKWREAEEHLLDLCAETDSGLKQYHLVKVAGSGKVVDVLVDSVPADDRKHLLTSAAISSDKATLLEKADSDRSGESKGLLEQLVESLET
jgi:hypothetical protein